MAKKATPKDYETLMNWQEAQNLTRHGSRGVPEKPVATSGKKTVPEVIDWGPGIPKDFLAYLNDYEMALVQKARKFKGKRSYKGVPAFPDPGDTAAGDHGQGTSSSAGLGNNVGGNYHSSDQRYGNSTGVSTVGNSTGGGSDSGGSTNTDTKVGDTKASTSTGTTTDTSEQQTAATNDAVSVVQTNTALKTDAEKGGIASIKVGPENESVPIGSRIDGAIEQNATTVYKDPQGTYPQKTVSSSVSTATGPLQGPTTYRGVTLDYSNGPTYTPSQSETVSRIMANDSLADYGRIHAPVDSETGGITDLRDDGIPRDASGKPIGAETPQFSNMSDERVLDVENVPDETAGAATSPSQAGIGPLQDYPRYVTPEQQKLIEDQETSNRTGIGILGKAPIVGPVLRLGQGAYKLATGNDIADESTNLKYHYMQASPEEQADMRAKYPDMRRFANSLGQDTSGDRATSSYGGGPSMNQGGQDTGSRAGIDALVAKDQMDRTAAEAAAKAAEEAAANGGKDNGGGKGSYNYGPLSGNRPAKYFSWDLGMKIPKPGDPDYNEYRHYLSLRKTNYQ